MRGGTPAGCLGVVGVWVVLLAWCVLANWPWSRWWFPGIAVAVWAVVWPVRRRQRRLLQQWMDDKCLTCGYDLRGIGRSGRCPECGTEFDGVSPQLERDTDKPSG